MTEPKGRLRVVGLTTGCPAGVGPEVAARAAATAAIPPGTDLVWFGHHDVLRLGAERAGLAFRLLDETEGGAATVDVGGRRVRTAGGHRWEGQAGAPDDAALFIQRESLLAAIAAAERGELDGICTAPIRKSALDQVPGGPWPGHTELLSARLGDGREAAMVFAGGPFLLGLATVHVPLREVAGLITRARLRWAVERLVEAVELLSPPDDGPVTVTVLGVNPHAGEGGRLGTEERDVMIPALEEMAREGLRLRGPVPTDGFYADVARGQPMPHAVLAPAHDVGLAPYKLLCQGAAVNVTVGLRVPRTSPDHGTGDAIAGKGLADAQSATAALELVARAALSLAREAD